MITLRYSPTSPFVRKAMICAHLKGVAAKIALLRTDAGNPDEQFMQDNPLAKIPVLTLESGATIYDSRVICEYLDGLGDGPRLFPEGEARWRVLTLGALADGIMDAMLLEVLESLFRDADKRSGTWLEKQRSKVARGVAAMEAEPPALKGAPHYGHVALACALGYLDLRQEGRRWRQSAPRLVSWLQGFAAAVPSFEETTPVGPP